MDTLLILLLLVAMGFVVFAVVRGLKAFANMQPNEVDENGVPKSLEIGRASCRERVCMLV